MTYKDALDEAFTALHILTAQECNKNLPPTLLKNCKERKKRFLKAKEIIKERLVNETTRHSR